MQQIRSWLDCGNHSWVGDDRLTDIPNGGGAMAVAMSAIHRIATKIAALPDEPSVAALEDA